MVFIGWYRCTRVSNRYWNLELRIVSSYLKTRDFLAVGEYLFSSDSAQSKLSWLFMYVTFIVGFFQRKCGVILCI